MTATLRAESNTFGAGMATLLNRTDGEHQGRGYR
jgi:hypothetical protein